MEGSGRALAAPSPAFPWMSRPLRGREAGSPGHPRFASNPLRRATRTPSVGCLQLGDSSGAREQVIDAAHERVGIERLGHDVSDA